MDSRLQTNSSNRDKGKINLALLFTVPGVIPIKNDYQINTQFDSHFLYIL